MYPKLLFLAILRLLAHIFKATTVKFGASVWTLPMPNFVKKSIKGIGPRGRFITKNPYFDDYGGLKPTFPKP